MVKKMKRIKVIKKVEVLPSSLIEEDLPAEELSFEKEASILEKAFSGLNSSSAEVVRYDPLQSYLSEIRNIPKLTAEEEHRLAVRYLEHGDKAAGYKLVVANLRLVAMIAREYQKNLNNMLDFIQEGNIGLLEAVKKYDPYQGVRFPSYAVYWVRAYMLRYLINNMRLVKIGTTQAQRKLFFNLQKEKEKLEKEGFAPEAALLAKRLDVKKSEVIEMEQRLALPDLSVDAPVRSTDGATDLHSLLPDTNNDLEKAVSDRQFADVLKEAVEEFKKTANEKERIIIDQRLFTDEPVTLQEIADQFKVSRERIRQIEANLKLKLKEHLSEKLQLGEDGEIAFGVDN
jgi:RNA polymerase sigma-32 factor